MSYLLLTGATGLLGRYLMRDLTLADIRLAVVTRPTKWESVAQRIETAMARWEMELDRALVRPVVLEGDISEPGLGLSARDLAWVAAHCSSVLHSAASLTFHADEASGEPWRSNVEGTRNVLQLCRQANIRRYHHISTAYVCGSRRGQILESELDVGQTLGNDYEQTKLLAETEVVSSTDFDQVTIYRPSIIVGDSQTGFTTSYHGFYTPLRIGYTLVQSVPWEMMAQENFLGELQLAGHETKNLVAVDWVSAAITHLISHEELHGQTYHLTNPTPATTLSMLKAIAEALAEVAQTRKQTRAQLAPSEDFVASFREQMRIYQAYWSDDPQFDSRRTEQAMPHLPCPVIDDEVMQRLVLSAIQTGFGWPREEPIVAPQDLAAQLAPWLAVEEATELRSAVGQIVNLRCSGRGGGQWHLTIEGGRLARVERGLATDADATCYLTSPTLAALLRGALPPEAAIDAGRLVVVGASIHPRELAKAFRELAGANDARIFENTVIG
ncbi:MAG TPA: SDR family oxidoreductase [Pirellulales bacterium]